MHNQRADIRIKLFDQRYAVYRAFKRFIEHCSLSEGRYDDGELAEFQKDTERIEYIFGPEIRLYHREIVANALAVRGILENLPCEERPVAGGVLGYFKGSTVLTEIRSLREWFIQQHRRDLYRYFYPYLDYGTAGVELKTITMTPTELPEPPIVRRRVSSA